MKKRLLVVLMASMMLSISACGNNDNIVSKDIEEEISVEEKADETKSSEDTADDAEAKNADGDEEDRTSEKTDSDDVNDSEIALDNNAGQNSFEDIVNTNKLYTGLVKLKDNTWANEDEEYKEFVEAIDKICDKYGLLSGSFLLATDDEVLYTKGMNSVETDGCTPVNAETVYEIGSMTKTYTATAVLQQIQAGNISPEDKVSKYIPALKKDVTIYQLLHMRSGLYDYVNDAEDFIKADPDIPKTEMMNYFKSGFMTDERFIDYLNKLPNKSEPDEKFEYCNTNYHLLAMVLENVSGKTFDEYVKENILDRVGLVNTTCAANGDVTVKIDTQRDGNYTEATYELRGCMDIHSSAEEILVFDRALLSNEFFGEDMAAEMFNMVDGYGCGMIEFDPNFYGHTGSTFTFSAVNFIYKTENFGNIYLIMLMPDKKHTLETQELSQAIYDICNKK